MVVVGPVAVCGEQFRAHLIRGTRTSGFCPERLWAVPASSPDSVSCAGALGMGASTSSRRGGCAAQTGERRDLASRIAVARARRPSRIAVFRLEADWLVRAASGRRALRNPASKSTVRLLMSAVAVGRGSRGSSGPCGYDGPTRARKPIRETELVDREGTNRRARTGTARSTPRRGRATARARGIGQSATGTLRFHRFEERT